MNIKSLLTTLAAASLAAAAQAQFEVTDPTILIDLQNEDGAAASYVVGGKEAAWNVTTGASGWHNDAKGTISELKSAAGSTTPVSLKWSGFLTIGSTELKAGAQGKPEWSAADMFLDGLFLGERPANLEFSGLEAGKRYRLIIHAQRPDDKEGGTHLLSMMIRSGDENFLEHDVYEYDQEAPVRAGESTAYDTVQAQQDNGYAVMEFTAGSDGIATWVGSASEGYPFVQGVVLHPLDDNSGAVAAASGE